MNHWTLVSGLLSDGLERLTLIDHNGSVVCEYAPGCVPHQDTWNAYMNGFPLQELVSRRHCIRHAAALASPRRLIGEPTGGFLEADISV